MTIRQLDPISRSWAILSDDERYRYRLGRRWDSTGPLDVWIMLNPSTADGFKDDPTITRCKNFSRGWGSSGLIVVNLFALRATKPIELTRVSDPVGRANDEHILAAVAIANQQGGRVIAAWGALTMAIPRAREVEALIDRTDLLALGRTAGGAPRHPLYVKGDTELVPL